MSVVTSSFGSRTLWTVCVGILDEICRHPVFTQRLKGSLKITVSISSSESQAPFSISVVQKTRPLGLLVTRKGLKYALLSDPESSSDVKAEPSSSFIEQSMFIHLQDTTCHGQEFWGLMELTRSAYSDQVFP